MVEIAQLQNSQLELIKRVADGITALFFPNVEVVIHDVTAGKIAYIANSISRRKPGDNAGLEELNVDKLNRVTGPYEKFNWDGKKMRSISIATGNEKNAGYLLCINLSTAVFEEARNALNMFLSVTRLEPKQEKFFRDDLQEKINTFIYDWIKHQNTSLPCLTRGQKKEVVLNLHKEGAFKAKNAADYIANVLSIGRTTIYKYLRELKINSK